MVAQNIEVRAQAIIKEMAGTGSALLKTGTQDQCNRLAVALAGLGACVTVTEMTAADQYTFSRK
jgi:hypothetical protein